MNQETKAALKGAVLDPPLVFAILKDGLKLRMGRSSEPPKTLVGTHHKVLTVYMARVFRAFSVITGQSFSNCRPSYPHVGYDKDVIVDYHSAFEFEQVTVPYRGIHIRRDPRDVLVSCVLYHLKSTEGWLHEEGNWGFHGSTYQKELRALGSMEERLIFEMDHVGGNVMKQMVAWDYAKPEFVELTYEHIVSEEGLDYIRAELGQSKLFDEKETAVIVNLFKIFSLQGVLAKKRHIRNPTPSQWKEHFTPKVEQEFHRRFDSALVMLGYGDAA